MIWLARKAFFGRVPFPALHVDTGKKFPEMYAFRDHFGKEWELDLKVEPCPPIDAVDPTLPPAARSAARKTEGLKLALNKFGFDGLIAGIRRDEGHPRRGARVLAARPRGVDDVRDQPRNSGTSSTPGAPGAHLHPPDPALTEADIWPTPSENIPIISLYPSRGQTLPLAGRCRHHLPVAPPPPASTRSRLNSTAPAPERAGRAPDHETEDAERLRVAGYL